MTKETFEQLTELASKLTPADWLRFTMHVEQKYSSNQRNLPLPSLEELREVNIFDKEYFSK